MARRSADALNPGMKSHQFKLAGISIICVTLASLIGAAPRVNRPFQGNQRETVSPAATTQRIDFTKDVWPIFAARCVQCHGPTNSMSGLRLDSPKALEGGVSGRVIVPGKSVESLLVRRISGQVEGHRMPPNGDPLSEAEIGTIQNWIDQGADWPDDPATKVDVEHKHWAYTPPRRPPLPRVEDLKWPRNPIDYFVLARLEKEGLRPSPETDRARLIRRLSLDLIGLPPTIEEVEVFLADRRPDAYERVVERLLASPHYGERWARHWLDLARYADSHGYESDPLRSMWKYRDWVIAAFNHNMPFDQFTIEQLAGDMLPNATLDQKIASGFHRNTMINMEGGVDAEETRVESIVDRTNTTATIWLGSTLACAQCHDHKYDPFSQKDYYRFFAFFNNTVDGQERDEKPEIEAPSPDQLREKEVIRSEIEKLESLLEAQSPELSQSQQNWESKIDNRPVDWTAIKPSGLLSSGGAALRILPDGSILAEGPNPENDSYTVVVQTDLKAITGLRIEVLPDVSLPGGGPGRGEDGAFVLSRLEAQVAAKGAPQTTQPIEWKRASADRSAPDFAVEALIANQGAGWSVDREKDKAAQSAIALIEAAEPAGFEQGTTLTITLRNRSKKKSANLGRFRLSVTTSAEPVSLPDDVRGILSISEGRRSTELASRLFAYYRSIAPELAEVRKQIAELKKSEPQFPKTMVMQEKVEPRETYIHIRGSFLNEGEKVTAAVPAIFAPVPEGQPANRLTLAKWLVSERNPLVARVAVNRIWEQYFGSGLVTTSGDFGTQGEAPSHPQLLDWLASQFVASKWNLKSMHRLIVTSATYRQSSKVSPELLQRDPYDRLLTRGPRFRLEAETIRDVALKASGLLSERVGGPSVFPPQPEGIWTQHYSEEKWTPSAGEDRYRRGLYTFWRRTSPYPTFFTFDAPSREFCTVRRPRTNTPLQALTTLNDPAFFEAARHLAVRMVTDSGPGPDSRVRTGFRLCVGRAPQPPELDQLLTYWKEQVRWFGEGARSMETLGVAGDLSWPAGTPVWEAAAWTMTANVLLNLDETITKE